MQFRIRRTQAATASAAALLLLAGCGTPAEVLEGAGRESPAGQSGAPTDSAEAGRSPLNCASVLPDDQFLVAESDPLWGLQEQVAMTDAEFVVEPVNVEFPEQEGLDTIAIDRGVACLAYGDSQSFMIGYTFAEFDPGQAEALAEHAADIDGAPDTLPNGALVYHDTYQGAEIWERYLVVGEHWLINIQGLGEVDEAFLDRFDGSVRDADANSAAYRPEHASTCSLFFPPLEGDAASAFAVKMSSVPALTRYHLEYPLQSSNQFDDDLGSLNPVCIGLDWHESEPGMEQPPAGDPVAANERCELYEVEPESRYRAFCDTGWAEIGAPLEIAERVLPPEFRGFE
ncbi:hypothetical protein [Gulosibacter sp. 10]|uniref:hypothetical protein n=1 Tax=Gulosibacter sp. 10 TaxID=1255570 RepID=UPI00097F492C|nr:hypothetical protein [Gulosibacter sp. 10]SJM48002.1 hypothetical protein FM112_00385 [Gulosibacter sp. 10]